LSEHRGPDLAAPPSEGVPSLSLRPSVKLIKNAQLKAYTGGAHGMYSTQKAQVNADLLTFLKGA